MTTFALLREAGIRQYVTLSLVAQKEFCQASKDAFTLRALHGCQLFFCLYCQQNQLLIRAPVTVSSDQICT
jgi:hypothetical protein